MRCEEVQRAAVLPLSSGLGHAAQDGVEVRFVDVVFLQPLLGELVRLAFEVA